MFNTFFASGPEIKNSQYLTMVIGLLIKISHLRIPFWIVVDTTGILPMLRAICINRTNIAQTHYLRNASSFPANTGPADKCSQLKM